MARRPSLDLNACLRVLRAHQATEMSHLQDEAAYRLYYDLIGCGCRFYKFLNAGMHPPFQPGFTYEAGTWMTLPRRSRAVRDARGVAREVRETQRVQLCRTGFHAVLPWGLREWAKAPNLWELEPNVRRPGDVVFGMGKAAFRRVRLREPVHVPGVTDRYVGVSGDPERAPGVQPGGQAELVSLLMGEHDAGRPVQRLRHRGEVQGSSSRDIGIDEQVIRAGATALRAIPERVHLLREALPDDVYRPRPMIGPMDRYAYHRPSMYEDPLGEADLRPVEGLLRELGVTRQQMDRFRGPSINPQSMHRRWWNDPVCEPYLPRPTKVSSARRAGILALLGATVTNPDFRLRALHDVLDLPVVALKLLGLLDEDHVIDSEDLGVLVYRHKWAEITRWQHRSDPPMIRRAA